MALLPPAIGVIMFGLGLSLTLADFARVVRYPRAVIVGLLVQTVVLVAVAFAITRLFALPPLLAVGLMLLAASPGGVMANVFSHLAHGDVALNITLTAINSLLALVWLPLVMNLALGYFLGAEQHLPPPTQKMFEVAKFIVLPVIVGMLVRRLWAAGTARRESGASGLRAAAGLRRGVVDRGLQGDACRGLCRGWPCLPALQPDLDGARLRNSAAGGPARAASDLDLVRDRRA